MSLPFEHEVVAPHLHRFVFPSASRPGLTHELWLDLDAAPEDRLSCLCEAALYGKFCKHKRFVIQTHWGRVTPARAAARWVKRRGRRGPPHADT